METFESAGSLYHVPALLEEAVGMLVTDPDGIYIDATFGGGGHTREILRRLGPKGRLYGFDRDMDAYANKPADPRFTFIHSNFRHIRNFMRFYGVEKVDGILADLGVSFHHFDSAERGFSFRHDMPLDMRMNRQAGQTAADIIAKLGQEEILDLLKTHADLKRPGEVAKAIVRAREVSPLATTAQLAAAVTPALDPRQEKKELAQVFQTFRIVTNNEMADLTRLLEASPTVLADGGRLAVITYHSGEDRLVKNFMKTGNIEGKTEKDFYGNVSTPWKLLTRKPVEPSQEEIEKNPRSRSARLRVAQYDPGKK